MKTSTIKDIENNIEILQGIAIELATHALVSGDEEAWEAKEIAGMHFDFNVFIWLNDENQDVVNVTVYPVIYEDANYGVTDTLNFMRLAQRNCVTGKMHTLLLGAW